MDSVKIIFTVDPEEFDRDRRLKKNLWTPIWYSMATFPVMRLLAHIHVKGKLLTTSSAFSLIRLRNSVSL